MTTCRKLLAGLLALFALLPALGCGSKVDSASDDPAPVPCRDEVAAVPVTSDPMEALAAMGVAEATLVAQGRTDSGLDAAFEAETADRFAELDAQRTKVIEAAAADNGVVLPDENTFVPEGTTCDTLSGSTRQSLGVLSLMGTTFAIGMLDMLVQGVQAPGLNGALPSHPPLNESSQSVDGGVTTHTTTTMNIEGGGTGSSVYVVVKISGEITKKDAAGTTIKSIKETADIMVSIDVCPNEQGIAHGTILVRDAGQIVGSESNTYHAEIENWFDLVVDDSAEITGIEIRGSLNYVSRGLQNANVSLSGSFGFPPNFGGSATHAELTSAREEGTPEHVAQIARSLIKFGTLAAVFIADRAKKKWQGGTCVSVKVDPPSKNVGKSEQVHVTAKPHHEFEKRDLPVPVVATLAGVASVAPENSPVRGPEARFDYVAGAQDGDRGTITLTSKSKRGIGTTSVTYTVGCGTGTFACVDGKVAGLPCAFSGTSSVSLGGETGMSAKVRLVATRFEGCSVVYEPTSGTVTWMPPDAPGCAFEPVTVDISAANRHGTFTIGLSPATLVADLSADWAGKMLCGTPPKVTSTPMTAAGVWIYVPGKPVVPGEPLTGTSSVGGLETTWNFTPE